MIDEEYLGDISTDDLKEGVYAGLIYGLDDVYSRYYTKEQYDQENATTEGSYVGIGVSMQQNAAGGVQIVECYKGSTAEEAGIKAGDVITAIDGEDITDAELSDVVSMIKKKAGRRRCPHCTEAGRGYTGDHCQSKRRGTSICFRRDAGRKYRIYSDHRI